MSVAERNSHHVIWQRCATVHPTRIALLCATFIAVLADSAGVERQNPAFAPLRRVQTVHDLATYPWGGLYADLRLRALIPAAPLQELVTYVRLFAELAVVHQRLYLARSGSTLKLLGRDGLPPVLPPELAHFRREFEECLREADQALRTGRAGLTHFQRQAEPGQPLPALLWTTLKRAQASYEQYCRALGRATWYLSWGAEREQRRIPQAGLAPAYVLHERAEPAAAAHGPPALVGRRAR